MFVRFLSHVIIDEHCNEQYHAEEDETTVLIPSGSGNAVLGNRHDECTERCADDRTVPTRHQVATHYRSDDVFEFLAVTLLWLLNTDRMVTHTGGGSAPRKLSRKMADALLQFMRTGNPNCRALPRWPRYTPQRGELIILDSKCRAAEDPDRSARNTFNDLIHAYHAKITPGPVPRRRTCRPGRGSDHPLLHHMP